MKWPQWGSSDQKALGLPELIAIALGGMIGGGIFTILGISVDLIGPYTPIAILAGGLIAALAAYSYVKLGVYYRDEGATYGFFKRTFPASPVAAALIGWYVISFALLIAGLVAAFPPLWIAAVVLLLLPIAAAIIFGIVFFIMFATEGLGEC